MWLTILFGCTTVAFLSQTLATLFHLRWARRLPSLESLSETLQSACSDNAGVLCSVVVAARDEEARIEETVRRLLAQRAAPLEVIVVDDRSTDRTGEIVQRLAAEDMRVRPLRVEALPERWLGKCHACYLGAAAAAGEWILFTDADCWLKPDVLVRALRVAEAMGADHVTLTPGVVPWSFAAQAWHLAFLIGMANWISNVNRDRPRAHLGMGAFNLVRAATYRRCGGYEALRLTIVDDVKLGLLMRRAGGRTRAFIGGDDVECHWGTTAWNAIKIVEKNYFAMVDFRLVTALAAVLGGAVLWSAALLGPATGTVSGMFAGLSLLSVAIPAGAFARRLGWSAVGALLTPFIFPLLFYAMWNSTWVTLRQGGVRWRDTFYPLELLRKEGVR